MKFSIEISSDIANRDERIRVMTLHSEASRLEALAKTFRQEAELVNAQFKKRREQENLI